MTSGTFGSSVDLELPSNFDSSGAASLNGVSCTAPGDCVAVGYYWTSSSTTAGFVAVQTGGTFAQAVGAPPRPATVAIQWD